MKLIPVGFKALMLSLIVGLCLAGPRVADAQGYYMKIDSIPGDVLTAGHTDEIALTTLSFAIGREVSHTGGQVTFSPLNVSEISVTKILDKASVNLAGACIKGDSIPTIHIFVTVNGSNGVPVLLYEIGMKDVIISAVSGSGTSSDGRPTESISLNYGQISWTYYTAGVGVTKGWNAETQAADDTKL